MPNAPSPATEAALAAATPRREIALRRDIISFLISSLISNSRIFTPHAKTPYMNIHSTPMASSLMGSAEKQSECHGQQERSTRYNAGEDLKGVKDVP
jgi:hypothetical protein